ncbi:KATNB1-like protein 1 [Diadema antillarum]|uniref:KATNB1-like protein 1 n=1 Tax=Diadema antillarum TaxID=105358 RepID=UPI003A859BE0
MADRARGHNADGGFVKWDWNKNKYVWVSNNDIKRKPSKPGQSNYAGLRHGNKPAAKRPSYQVPVKKAYRQPLQVANKHGQVKSPSPRKPSARHHVERPFLLPPYNDDIRCKDLNKENIPAGRHSELAGKGTPPPPPPELHAGHLTIQSVLSNRLIHLNAALTFWRQGPNAFISYLLRTEDDAATVDALPVLVNCMKNKTPVSKQLSMGACFELLPTLKKLLGSKFEDYVKTSLDVIRTMLRFWWTDLVAHRNSKFSGSLQESRSIAGIYTGSVALTDVIAKLCKRKDTIGKKAEVVGTILAQL